MKKAIITTIAVLLCWCGVALGDVTTGLIGYWPLNAQWQDSSTVMSNIGSGDDDLILFGSPPVTNSYTEFDGSTQACSISNFYNGSAISIFMWINTTEAGSAWIVDKRNVTTDKQFQLVFYLGKFAVSIMDGSTTIGKAEVSQTNVSGQGWKHIGFTTTGVNGGSVVLYIDGSPVDSDTLSGNMKLGSRLLTFAGNNWIGTITPQLSGDLSDVRIYDRALSPTDVTELYNLGRNAIPNASVQGVSLSGVGVNN